MIFRFIEIYYRIIEILIREKYASLQVFRAKHIFSCNYFNKHFRNIKISKKNKNIYIYKKSNKI